MQVDERFPTFAVSAVARTDRNCPPFPLEQSSLATVYVAPPVPSDVIYHHSQFFLYRFSIICTSSLFVTLQCRRGIIKTNKWFRGPVALITLETNNVTWPHCHQHIQRTFEVGGIIWYSGPVVITTHINSYFKTNKLLRCQLSSPRSKQIMYPIVPNIFKEFELVTSRNDFGAQCPHHAENK